MDPSEGPRLRETDINWGLRAHDIGRFPAEVLAERVAAMGFRHVQLALPKAVEGIDARLGSLSPGMGRRIRRILGERGVEVSVLGCYIDPVHPDDDARRNHLGRFAEHLRYCRDFGCSVVGTETGANRPGPGSDGESLFLEFVESLRLMADAAEKAGCIAAIEAVADKDVIGSHRRLARALEMVPSPNLGVIYDPVNLLPAGGEGASDALMEEAFAMFAPRMVAIHAKDYAVVGGRLDKTLPAGAGSLNYPLLLSLVRERKPMIPVLLENNRPETLGDTIAFVNGLE